MSSGYDLSPVFSHSIGSTSTASSSNLSSSSSSAIAISPGSTFIACIADAQTGLIVIRESQSATVAASFRCVLPPDNTSSGETAHGGTHDTALRTLTWSPDGLHLLASSPSHGVAWVFALAAGGGEPRAIIVAGPEGMMACEWGKGSTEVLVWAEHGVSQLGIRDGWKGKNFLSMREMRDAKACDSAGRLWLACRRPGSQGFKYLRCVRAWPLAY